MKTQNLQKNKVKKQPKKQRVIMKDTHSDVINCMLVTANGHQPNKRRGTSELQFVDFFQASSPTSVGTILSGIDPIAQGITVQQRVGDTIYLVDLFWNYTLNAFNTDLVSTTRVILFQWHPNSGLLAPIVTDILQTASVYSMYSWQFSNQYTILYDRTHFSAGSGTIPVSSSNQGFFGRVSLAKARKKVQFTASSAVGANELFILLISDSVIAPFPVYNGNTRVVFSLE